MDNYKIKTRLHVFVKPVESTAIRVWSNGFLHSIQGNAVIGSSEVNANLSIPYVAITAPLGLHHGDAVSCLLHVVEHPTLHSHKLYTY